MIKDENKKCWTCMKLDELAYCRIHELCPVLIEEEIVLNCRYYVERRKKNEKTV